MDRLVRANPGMGILMMKQNPEHPDTGRAAQLVSTFGYIDYYAEQTGASSVDIYSAFQDTDRQLELIDETLFHPTPEGYQLWFETVRDAIGEMVPGAKRFVRSSCSRAPKCLGYT